jgi:hypothetical protein
MPTISPGSLVRARGRDWVVLPSQKPDLLLRPLTGGDDEVAGLFLPLERRDVAPTSFPPPDPGDVLAYCRESIGAAAGLRAQQQRVRHWAAIALLRCVLSRPGAATAALSERARRQCLGEERRALLRAELDAYYARLYGLTRKQLRYILDPHDLTDRELANILDRVEDPQAAPRANDFPGQTFRVLKDKEIKQYGEYRTKRLVLAEWDNLERPGKGSCRAVAASCAEFDT